MHAVGVDPCICAIYGLAIYMPAYASGEVVASIFSHIFRGLLVEAPLHFLETPKNEAMSVMPTQTGYVRSCRKIDLTQADRFRLRAMSGP